MEAGFVLDSAKLSELLSPQVQYIVLHQVIAPAPGLRARRGAAKVKPGWAVA